MRTSKPSPTPSGKGQAVRYGMLWVWLVILAYTLVFFFLQHRDVEIGRYEIRAGLYYWEDGKRVEIVEGDGDRANSVVPLGSVTVDANGQRGSDDL